MITKLDPIALDELNARAGLLARFDRKYLVAEPQLPQLLRRLAPQVRVLSIDDRRDFGYRSVYFDSPTLSCYRDAALRRRRRFKVRVRTYLDSGERFFEVKVRGPRGRTVKHRTPCRHESLEPETVAFGQSTLAGAGLGHPLTGFRPVLTTCYRRTTLFVPATGGRITLDTGVRWEGRDGTTAGLTGAVLIETKSPRPVPEIDRVLWALRHRPVTFSKYGTGLTALDPTLTGHRWRPILRRHPAATLQMGQS